MNVQLVKLHQHDELIDIAVKILNDQWPRSKIARLHSLSDSRDDFPCCLLLIAKDNQQKSVVIGHSKLARVHGKSKSLFIENVVIDKGKRGLGFGRKLMELSEDYAHKQGFEDIYLSTHDKCKFYEHLGYCYTCAVSPVRANAKLLTPDQFSALQHHFGGKTDGISKQSLQNDDFAQKDGEDIHLQTIAIAESNHYTDTVIQQMIGTLPAANIEETVHTKLIPPAPPPVPPPPQPRFEKDQSNMRQEIQYWMMKQL
ncbi:uncharacterized protein LOC110249134 isoform X1 [Exaiptasia diaphana]|uniref:N-acetyltransferase domain-containing protein n=1 Tax=Exaiptasia diaphana TaxID=2652724 RepID=A0A913XYS2_EXADI|nr:uncharacterized protein LOC110249134 isoform X1 [Exaiptasia diaphana]KXJ08163.1 N-acetyltransferase 6 [Exaiptasia diaphana]